MKISITGTRHGLTPQQRAFMRGLSTHVTWLVHGGCVGADRDCHALFAKPKQTAVYPSNREQWNWAWDQGVKLLAEIKPPLERNHDIVDATPLLYAFPYGYTEVLRSGTWATIRYARKIGHAHIIVWPDGSTAGQENALQLPLSGV